MYLTVEIENELLLKSQFFIEAVIVAVSRRVGGVRSCFFESIHF